jgi:hypothetical protein
MLHSTQVMGSESKTVPFRGKIFRGAVTARLAARLTFLLDDPEAADGISGSRRVLSGPFRTIWEISIGGDTFFVHLFRHQRREILDRIVRMQTLLRRMQIGTFDVCAVGRETGHSGHREFFIARKIDNAVSLPAGLGHRYEVVPEAPDLPDKLSVSLAQFISGFHLKRIIHGDLKSRHILLQQGAGMPRFFLVDLEKARRLRYLPERLVDVFRVRDLIQLSASCGQIITRSQKTRFLRNYLRRLSIPAERRRTFYFVLRLYSIHDFRQGRTLLENILGAIRP